MKSRLVLSMIGVVLSLASAVSNGGPLDPDCTAAKAAKSTAMKATVGVGGRCSPAQVAKDATKKAVGVDEKGPLEKRRDDDGLAEKAAKKAVK
jgi:hypothetical protein